MTTQYRIALISAFPPSTKSLNEYGLHLAKGFAAREDVSEVIVLADHLDEPAEELDLGQKVKVQRVWAFNKTRSQTSLISAARAARADSLIFNIQTASFGDREIPAATGLMTPGLLRRLGQHVGLIAHNIIGGVDLDKTILKGQKMRQMAVRTMGSVVTRAMLNASYTTVTLPSFLDILKSAAPRASTHLVPHGTFEGAAAETHAPSKRGLTLNTMGKFGTYKRLDTLLKAFDLVRQNPTYADLRLEIGGGDHPNTPGYMADLAKERADDAGVEFLGYVAEEEVPDFFARARLSVFDYSTTTGSSGVMHQAVSNGAVPIFPMIDDFVDLAKAEGIVGFNYATNDAEDMARALTEALDNPARLDTLAAENFKAAEHTPFADVIDFHMHQIPGFLTLAAAA